MSNAASKPLRTLLLAALILGATTSCTSEAERRAARAEALRLEAETLAASGDCEQSLALLDSLDRAYREQTDVRRRAMATRATAIERRSLQLIGPADSLLAASQLRVDSLGALFVHIDGPRGLEGHYVARELRTNDVTASTGIEPRVDAEGYLSIAAVVKGRRIGLNSLSITTPAGTQRVEPVDGARSIESEGTELTSFRQEEVAHLLEALAAAEGSPVSMHLDGTRGSVELKLSPAMRTALLRTWQYAMACQRLRSARIERERLERTLQTARDHRANAPLPEAE